MSTPHEEAVVAVTQAASRALEIPAEDLPPLTNVIAVDALNQLMHASPGDEVTVSFTYAGLHIILDSNGTVHAIPPQAKPPNHTDGSKTEL